MPHGGLQTTLNIVSSESLSHMMLSWHSILHKMAFINDSITYSMPHADISLLTGTLLSWMTNKRTKVLDYSKILQWVTRMSRAVTYCISSNFSSFQFFAIDLDKVCDFLQIPWWISLSSNSTSYPPFRHHYNSILLWRRVVCVGRRVVPLHVAFGSSDWEPTTTFVRILLLAMSVGGTTIWNLAILAVILRALQSWLCHNRGSLTITLRQQRRQQGQ